jgi:hypothetical protein
VIKARLNNLWWEYRLGVSTRGIVPTDHPDSVHYATMRYSTVWTILRHLDLRAPDVFMDIGSGKGRVLCCAARHRVTQEFDYSATTVLFMFDPFGAATLEPVLEKIGRDTRGRDIRLAYVNPTHDAVVRQQPWLDGREFWAKEETGLEHDVAFYRGRAA